MHAWQQPEIGFAPDIMTVGKALGDSTMPAGALMIHKDVNEKLAYGDSLEELPTIPDCLRPVRVVSPAVEDINRDCSMKAHGNVGGEEGVWCEGLRRVFILTKRKIGLSYDNNGNKVKELGELLEREVKKRLAEHDIAPGSSASPVRGIHSRGLFLGIRFSGGAADLSQRAAEIASNSHGVHLRLRDGCLVVAPPLDVTEAEIVDIASGTAAALGEARNEALEAAGALPACRSCRKIQVRRHFSFSSWMAGTLQAADNMTYYLRDRLDRGFISLASECFSRFRSHYNCLTALCRFLAPPQGELG